LASLKFQPDGQKNNSCPSGAKFAFFAFAPGYDSIMGQSAQRAKQANGLFIPNK
jgi:hypothetical protein